MGILHAFMILSALEPASTALPNSPSYQVRSLRVTVLSTMLTDFHGLGEWGFAALVEVDGRLTRKTGVVGAIGSSFSLEGGIDPLALAR